MKEAKFYKRGRRSVMAKAQSRRTGFIFITFVFFVILGALLQLRPVIGNCLLCIPQLLGTCSSGVSVMSILRT